MSHTRNILNTFIIPLILLIGAAGAGFVLFKSRDKPSKSEQTEKAVAVETIEVHRTAHTLDVAASGTVVPARQLDVYPQASGRLTWLYESLDPGTFVEEGQTLFRIDAEDYQRTIRELEAAVKQARAQLAVEEGRHQAAVEEWEHYKDRVGGSDQAPSLAVREPQLASAKANLEAAEARLASAKTQLGRTRFRAPFNAVIIDSMAEIGQLVGPQVNIARLVGTDKFRVLVSVRTDQLRHIAVPGIDGKEGSEVTVRQHIGDGEVVRTGRVLRLLSDLEPGSRMARVLVEVDDPYGLANAGEEGERPYPLLLDAFVDVRIEGQNTAELIEVPRKAVREGDRAFVFDQTEGRLAIRDLSVKWRRPQTVLVSEGLEDGDRIITSPLATPVDGMKLRDLSSDQPEAGPVADEEATDE